MALRGDHDVIADATLPLMIVGAQHHPALQHLQRRLTRRVVLAEYRASRQSDQGLTQVVLPTAVNRDGRPT